MVVAAGAGTAAAAPNIWVVDANLDQRQALSGERVTVTVDLKNTGDDGTVPIEVRRNGSTRTTERFQVRGNSEKTVNTSIRLNKTGFYEITVSDGTRTRRAGYLTVSNVRVASVSDRSDGRTVRLRGGRLDGNGTVTAALPSAPNQTFAVDSVSLSTDGSAFNRSVATYAPAARASFATPDTEGSTVLGAVDMDSISGVDTTRMRIRIDRDTIREQGLEADHVVVYRRSGDGFEALPTAQAETTTDAIVYEAGADGGDQFVVGSLAPVFAVESREISTRSTDDGKRINVTARVTNQGPVAGNYTASMQINGATQDERTVTIGAGETEQIVLQYAVTEQGDYDVSVNNRSVGSVVLTGDGAAPTDREATTDGGNGGDGDGGIEPELPDAAGSNLVQVGVGAAIVLIGGALLIVRRR